MHVEKVFNRKREGSDWLLRKLQQVAAATWGERQACVENFVLDHRVSADMETEFRALFNGAGDDASPEGSLEQFKGWVDSYRKWHETERGEPWFFSSANQGNRLPDSMVKTADGTSGPRLATLIKSSYLREQWRAELIREFEGSEDPGDNPQRQFALYAKGREKFARAFCAAWNRKVQEEPQNPRWAADWADFCAHSYEQRQSAHWEMLVGKEPTRRPYIVALCVYPFAHARDVFRPTILDACGNYLHYPSPPWREVEKGGLTVAIGACCDCEPLSEYIHRDLPFEPHHFLSFQLHTPAAAEAAAVTWQEARSLHREKLRRQCPGAGQFADWHDGITA